MATETNPLVQRFLGLPEVDVEQIDGAKRLEAHAAVLRRKPMLAEVFRECHHAFMDLDLRCFGDTPGMRLELGAGVAPVRSTYSEVLATDVVPGAGLDRVIDAMDIDVPEGSVRALYGQNCFHHFPEPERFLASAAARRGARWGRDPHRALLRAGRVGPLQAPVCFRGLRQGHGRTGRPTRPAR